MKTQILQLEPHDDMISARDKMGWSQTSRILLVWPNRGQVLTSRLDLEMLLRHSRSLGAQIALVTKDPDVHYHAKQLGIQVFRKVRQAQNTRWKRPHRRKLKPPHKPGQTMESISSPPRRADLFNALSTPARLGFFSMGVFALLAIAAVLLPSAEIELNPKTQIQAITIPVKANIAVEKANLSGLVPIRAVSVVVEGRDSLVPTGSTRVPEHRATGKVRFTNLTDREITVPAKTVVSTIGSTLRFATDRAGEVPAGAGETLELPITALSPGSHSNLPIGLIKAIEGSLGLSLTVTNPQSTQGGTDRTTLAPTSSDRTRLTNQLMETLQESARAEIQTLLEPNDILITPKPSRVQVLEEIYDPPDPQPTSLLSLTLRAEFQALSVFGEDLRQLATAALDANIPAGDSPHTSALKIEHTTKPRMSDGPTANWEMRASRMLQAQLAEPQVTSITLGLTPAEATQQILRRLPIDSPPRIEVTPSWWPRLPFLPFRIHVAIVEQR